jgi:hypothetical protein
MRGFALVTYLTAAAGKALENILIIDKRWA